MPVGIPLRTDLTYYTLLIVLDSVNYTLQFRWNLREGAWYMDVLDDTGTTMITAGIKIVVNYQLGYFLTGRNPPGIFAAWDTSGQDLDPGISDLGDRVRLLYFTAAEVAAMGT